jgi:hypothetical protein
MLTAKEDARASRPGILLFGNYQFYAAVASGSGIISPSTLCIAIV